MRGVVCNFESALVGGLQVAEVDQPGGHAVAIANVGSRAGYNYGRPHLLGDPKLASPIAVQWFNPAAFVRQVDSYGSAGRNILRVDDVFNTDLSRFKTIPIQERKELQIRFWSI
jgi:hypothetical protein